MINIKFDSSSQLVECDYNGAKFSFTIQLLEDLERIHGLKDAGIELLNLVAAEHKINLSDEDLTDFKTRLSIIRALISLHKINHETT